MDPLVQLVKELLESSDPQIKVVVCLPDRDPAGAKSGSDLTLKPVDPETPQETSPENPPHDPGRDPN
jgi:hypothetical protein